MFYAREYGLFDYILKRHGAGNALAVADWLARTGLPQPDRMEYYDSNEGGAIIFLNPYGATLRLCPRARLLSDSALRHPALLQPLGTVGMNDTLCLDVMPGVIPGCTKAERDALESALARDGLSFNDAKIENCGQIHSGATRHIVVIDLPAVMQDRPFTTPSAPSFQQRHFTTLYTHFKAASDQPTLSAFWSACAAATKSGLLQSAWKTNVYRNIGEIAAAYERRLYAEGAPGLA